MAEKILHAVYDDDDKLLDAVKKIKAANYEIEEVYTPFPVHGLDKVLGLKDTRIAITAFIYGCIGFCFSIWMMMRRGCIARPFSRMLWILLVLAMRIFPSPPS